MFSVYRVEAHSVNLCGWGGGVQSAVYLGAPTNNGNGCAALRVRLQDPL